MNKLTMTLVLCAAMALAPVQAQARAQINNNTNSKSDIAVALFVIGVTAILLSRNGGFASSKSEKAPNSTGAKGRILQKF